LPDDDGISSEKDHDMAGQVNPAPRDTAVLTEAIKKALAGIPEIHRKAALKHATEAVWQELIAQSEHAKAAAREAPPELGAKAAAATNAIQEMTEATASADGMPGWSMR
jgi:hypothetical protein